MHNQETVLNDKGCSRCGCWLKKHFKCGCGDVESDYCVNCGRWTTLGQGVFVELSEYDVRCEVGSVMHEHHPEEKSTRIAAWVSREVKRA